jgi:hypothetical protein
VDWENIESNSHVVEDRLLRLGDVYRERKERRAKEYYDNMFSPTITKIKKIPSKKQRDRYWKGKTLRVIKGEQDALQSGLQNILFPDKQMGQTSNRKSTYKKKTRTGTMESYNVFGNETGSHYSDQNDEEMVEFNGNKTHHLSFGANKFDTLYDFN